MLLDTPIQTPRLTLRQIAEADAGARYTAWLNDPDVIRHLEMRLAGAQTESQVRDFVRAVNASGDSLMLAICLNDTQEHIGNIKIGPILDYHRRGDIGFLIGERAHWGKGYATEAVRAFSDHCLDVMGLAKITAGCYSDNLGSARTLIAAGFFHEATLVGHWVCEDRRVDGHLFGKWRVGAGHE